MIVKRLLLLLALLSALPACRPQAEVDFVLYLLPDEISSADLLETDPADLPCASRPLLSTGDLVAYRRETHAIELTQPAFERVIELFSSPVKTDGIPFVVCLDRSPVYAGAFWTPLSSQSYAGVVILQTFDLELPVIHLELGYPGTVVFTGDDPRSNPRLLEALDAAGKLR